MKRMVNYRSFRKDSHNSPPGGARDVPLFFLTLALDPECPLVVSRDESGRHFDSDFEIGK